MTKYSMYMSRMSSDENLPLDQENHILSKKATFQSKNRKTFFDRRHESISKSPSMEPLQNGVPTDIIEIRDQSKSPFGFAITKP